MSYTGRTIPEYGYPTIARRRVRNPIYVYNAELGSIYSTPVTGPSAHGIGFGYDPTNVYLEASNMMPHKKPQSVKVDFDYIPPSASKRVNDYLMLNDTTEHGEDSYKAYKSLKDLVRIDTGLDRSRARRWERR